MKKTLMKILELFVLLIIIICSILVINKNLNNKETNNVSYNIKFDNNEIVSEVMRYINGDIEENYIEYEDNIFIKNSNINGIEINKIKYYYSLFPHQSYDPLSLSKVSKDSIDILKEINNGSTILIYTLKEGVK